MRIVPSPRVNQHCIALTLYPPFQSPPGVTPFGTHRATSSTLIKPHNQDFCVMKDAHYFKKNWSQVKFALSGVTDQ
uniref:Uncharacterized protein n=1 Tax=Steinernema glaseri TaxID=37863 RepID=A0A1I7YCD3_9BILA